MYYQDTFEFDPYFINAIEKEIYWSTSSNTYLAGNMLVGLARCQRLDDCLCNTFLIYMQIHLIWYLCKNVSHW